MSFTADTIFISYSRSDGRDFAEAFERRLAAEGIHSWRDLKNMGAGDIRPQVLRRIEGAKHLVLILSRRALVSDWIKREWSHARLMGKRVSPVLADPTLTRADLPPWMKREEVFDIDPARDRDAERWKALVQTLRGDGRVKRVPYMPGDLSADFVARDAEYKALRSAVLAEVPKRTVGLTTALRGAGGYGKTTLANALCRDDDVRFEFSDGILRVEIGKDRSDVTGLVVDLIEKLDPEGKRPGFADVVTASEHLGELLGESRILLVIDDVWREAQLRPFLRGGRNCIRLVTTRLPGMLPADHVPVRIDEMRAAEAARLIGVNLPGAEEPANGVRLVALSAQLGNWAQMLAIANGWLRERVVEQGEGLAEAIARFESRLARKGPFVFDPADKTQRDKALRLCIEVSTSDLDEEKAARFADLAVLPEDEDVPLHVVEALWAETGGLDEDDTDDLVRWLDRHSLLQSLDLGRRTLRLHDNILWYLGDRLGKDGLKAAHAAMVLALQAKIVGPFGELPASHTYGWRFLIVHLRGAGEGWTADELLSEYGWIKAKLQATDARTLYDSYRLESSDLEVGLIGQAIALSLPALAADKRELALQIVGRLGQTSLPCAVTARLDGDCRPMPRWPGLTPPGAERLCLRGHERGVTSAAFSPDGARIVTASYDGTARIWDAATGAEIAALRGHDHGVASAAFSPDGARIVTASVDRTARIWDAATGAEMAALRGHGSSLTSASYSFDSARIVTASDDRTARIWDAATGVEIVALRGHDDWARSAAFSPDGSRVVTASRDRTARIWDAATGAEIVTLRGHHGSVQSAAFSPDGTRIVTASLDHTTRIWDAATGAEIVAHRGHDREVNGAAFSPDGSRVVTASDDRTARIWDAASSAEVGAARGHNAGVNSVAFSPDGDRIVTASEDQTACIWDAATGAKIIALGGHWDAVNSATFSSDGARVVAASDDETARIWDAATGAEIVTLRGHERWVRSAAFSPDGKRIVTASLDHTARIWDAATGAQLVALRGHADRVYRAAFSPDGAHIVTASLDHTARIWDAATGAEIVALRGHEELVRSAAFSDDGARIVTASWDRTARIWDAATGAEIAAIRGHVGAVNNAAFSPDGARIVTASDDRTARIWDTTTGAEIAHVTLDAAVTALSIHGTAIALGDRLGRIHVFDAEDFLG